MGKCNLEESRVKQYNEQLLAYQNQAMRTLGVAYKVIPENSSTDCAELVKEGGLTFMGILRSVTRFVRMCLMR